jgi:hypothetical protein
MVSRVTDFRRGLDYLDTRADIDPNKIAFLDISSEENVIVPAVDPRYQSVVLMGFGLPKVYLNCIDEANPIYFAPHIRAPKLMLNGLYDEADNFKSAAEPLSKPLIVGSVTFLIQQNIQPDDGRLSGGNTF